MLITKIIDFKVIQFAHGFRKERTRESNLYTVKTNTLYLINKLVATDYKQYY